MYVHYIVHTDWDKCGQMQANFHHLLKCIRRGMQRGSGWLGRLMIIYSRHEVMWALPGWLWLMAPDLCCSQQNGYWWSLGFCALCFIPLIILAVIASTHYLRQKGFSNDDAYPEFPWVWYFHTVRMFVVFVIIMLSPSFPPSPPPCLPPCLTHKDEIGCSSRGRT